MSIIDDIAAGVGLGPREVARVVVSAPARYKIYTIPKRGGGRRTIAHPSRELKAIQRFLAETLLVRFPVHPAATAYVTGRGIFENASAHRFSRAILKLDFQSFFPSITVSDFNKFLRGQKDVILTRSDEMVLSQLLFWSGERKSTNPRFLSIGAPTSPMISNIMMYHLDIQLSELANSLNVVYTRYADDISVSGDGCEVLLQFEDRARRLIAKAKYPKLTFNEEKRGIYFKGQRQMITGLVLTPEGAVSIGRDRKREISALIHRWKQGEIAAENRGRVKGLLAFSIAIEPDFIGRMRNKYGSEIIDQILRDITPKRGRELRN